MQRHNAETGTPVSGRISSGFHVGKASLMVSIPFVNHAVNFGSTVVVTGWMDRSKKRSTLRDRNGPREA